MNNGNLQIRAEGVKLLIKDSFDRSNALREQAFIKKIGTVKPSLRNPVAFHGSDHLIAKILAAA